jgi:hypothetical protein
LNYSHGFAAACATPIPFHALQFGDEARFTQRTRRSEGDFVGALDSMRSSHHRSAAVSFFFTSGCRGFAAA